LAKEALLPKRFSSAQITAILLAHGFIFVSQKGSHQKYRHSDGRIVIIPAGRKTIPIGTTLSIIRQSGMARTIFN
jgi:predicted RNA binding protein YcfA (HicA-like mRNA interferase family)